MNELVRSNGEIIVTEPHVPARQERGFMLVPQNVPEARILAKVVAESGFYKDTEASIMMRMIRGLELGFSVGSAIAAVNNIQGTMSLTAEAMVAVVKKQRGICEYFQILESSSSLCRATTKRVGDPEPTGFEYTWEDAVRAGLVGKDNWKKHPAAMLRARCLSGLARMVYQDILMGLYTPDEAEEIAEEERRRREAEGPRVPTAQSVPVAQSKGTNAPVAPSNELRQARRDFFAHADKLGWKTTDANGSRTAEVVDVILLSVYPNGWEAGHTENPHFWLTAKDSLQAPRFGEEDKSRPTMADASPELPPAVQKPNTSLPRCEVEGCVNCLTSGQHTISMHKFGKALCLMHQREVTARKSDMLGDPAPKATPAPPVAVGENYETDLDDEDPFDEDEPSPLDFEREQFTIKASGAGLFPSDRAIQPADVETLAKRIADEYMLPGKPDTVEYWTNVTGKLGDYVKVLATRTKKK